MLARGIILEMINRWSFRRGKGDERRVGTPPPAQTEITEDDIPDDIAEEEAEPHIPRIDLRGLHTRWQNDRFFKKVRTKLDREEPEKPIRIADFQGRDVKVIRKGEELRTVRYDAKKVERDMRSVDRHRAKVTANDLSRRMQDTEETGKVRARKRAQGNERSRERASLTERLLGKMLPVLIPGAEIVRASEYDERRNGTDLVLLLRSAEGNVSHAWALDITSASSDEVCEKKMSQSLLSLAETSAPLSTLQYIVATRPNGEKEYLKLERVPKVVLGLSEQSVRFCGQMFMDGLSQMQKVVGSKFHAGLLKAFRDAFQGERNLIDWLYTQGDMSHLKPAEMEIDEGLTIIQDMLKALKLDQVREVDDNTRERVQRLYRSRPKMREFYNKALETQRQWNSRRESESGSGSGEENS